MKVGTDVILIGTDDYMPPLGSFGVIVEAMDDMGDYGVLFHGHPCPHPPGIHWYAYRTWLMPVKGDREQAAVALLAELEKTNDH